MRKFTVLLLLVLMLSVWNRVSAAVIDSVVVTQVDTFALKTMEAQPVLKIKISVSGIGTSTLKHLTIHTLNQSNEDVDNIVVYYTFGLNRFSLADYPGESFLLDTRKEIVGDSVEFSELSLVLEAGVHYFWITMDLSKISRVSHTIDARIKPNRIKIDESYFPATEVSPNGNIEIADIYYRENFESKNLSNEPAGWTQDQLDGSIVRWKCNYGGQKVGTTGSPHPSGPKSGIYNAMLQRDNPTENKTILESGPIDLSLSTRPMLTFYHAQVDRCIGSPTCSYVHDELRVLYKIGPTGTWNEIERYELATPNQWLKRDKFFPEGVNATNVYLGFEGTTRYGWGVCIDSLTIYETEVANRTINSISTINKITDMVPQGANNNPVIRVNIRVKGNTGAINLNSLTFTSNSTADSDIKANGVKLYFTNDSLFINPEQLSTAKSLVGRDAVFNGLNTVLETGDNYFWATYDVNTNSVPGHIIDAYLKAGSVGLSIAGVYPQSVSNPIGSRTIKQAMFFDDFDDIPQWSLTGEFQIDTARGKGGSKGRPDPHTAFSGYKILGTDISELGSNPGDYEPNISSVNGYTATSPLIDGKYFKNIELQFYRYLNIDNTDSATIEYKIENSSTWERLWVNGQRYIDYDWQKQVFSSLNFLRRKKFNIRFKLGPTDAIDNYSGWNIDYLYVIADSIPFDAAVTGYKSPTSACGLIADEHVTVYVKNTGPKPLVNTPIKLSLNGGQTYITETIPGPIAVDDSIEYTFSTASDFSNPQIYNLIVRVAHPQDNFDENDSIMQDVIAFPTYSLPYASSFEEDTTFWFAAGVNSSWYEGYPSGVINAPATGSKCWKTDISGYHKQYEFSYAESPCFTFSDQELPMIDIKFNNYTYPNSDGAILEYSIDEGENWNYASEDSYPFPWNWYNDTITSLKHKGWTNRTLDGGGAQIWKQGRQMLPLATANQTNVKFRFVFKSDSSTLSPYPGFAFDDFKIYDAPHDIGIEYITGLTDPACQYANSPNLDVVIKNYGYRKMKSGDSIFIGASVNGELQALDTLTLTGDLVKNATLAHTLKYPVDFAETGHYVIKAFTLNENDPAFYNTNNDTASFSLTVYQNPVTGLPDSLFSARIDTLQIIAIDSANYTYYWQGSGTPGTHIYSPVSDTGKYTLRVQNNISFCETYDTVVVKALIPDIAIESIISPTNSCGYDEPVHPIIKIRNDGTDTLRTNVAIPIRVKLNSNSVLEENYIITKTLAPDSSVVDTLDLTLDLSVPQTYALKVYSEMPYDTIQTNDTVSIPFVIYGYPTLNLGSDRVTVKDTVYQIVAPAGYTSYTWSNDSLTRFNTVKQTGWYIVTVTDNHYCPVSDSVLVFFKIRDIKPYKLVTPVTTCSNADSSSVVLRILNSGSDTLMVNDSIYLSYIFNGTDTISDSLRLATTIEPGDSIDFAFKGKQNLIDPGAFSFKFSVVSRPEPDFRPINDTVTYFVNTFGQPNPDLGGNNSIPALEYNLVPAGSGYVSYVWQDGSTDTSYLITRTHKSDNDKYQVSVIDKNGCSATSAEVLKVLIVNDVEVTSIVLPTSSCQLTSSETVKVKVKNVGNTPIPVNKIITLKYLLDGGGSSKIDTLTLTSSFIENQEIIHIFKQKADLSQLINHKIKAFVVYDQDVNLVNDTLTTFKSVYSNPVIDFGAINDTLMEDLPYILDAGPGYMSYLWNTNDYQSSISVVSTGKYTVQVVDMHGCVGSKSVTLIGKVFDLGITGFSTPLSNCKLTASEEIGVEITNLGNMPLTNQAFTIQYKLDGTIDRIKDFEFTGLPGDKKTFNFTETENLTALGYHIFNVSLTYALDDTVSNNTENYSVLVSGYPIVNLGGINDTIRTNSFPYTLDPGDMFTTYLWQDSSTNRTFSALAQGWFCVFVSNNTGCTGYDSVFIRSTLSVGLVSDLATLKLFPNPAHDNLWLEVNLKLKDEAIMELVNPEGKVIINRSLSGGNHYLEKIEVNNLPGGIYYIRVFNKKWVITDKVIIQ